MKLTDVQAKVIGATQLDADLTIATLRKRLKLREHAIRYALEKARSNGIIARRHFINLFRLGYLQHEVYFSLSSDTAGVREQLVSELIRSRRVSWMGKFGGDFHYGINVCSKHVSELLDLFEDLSERYGRVFIDKHLALRVSLTYFGHRYLAPSVKAGTPLSYRVTSDQVEIDEVDHKILSALTTEHNSSGHNLARVVGIPQSTVDLRLRKLKANQIIVGSYYNLHYDRIGILSYLCLLSTKGMASLFKEKAVAYCEQHNEIVVLIESIGSWDFEFVINVTHAEDAMRHAEKLLDLFGRDIQWMKTIPLFSYPKVHEYPF